MANSNPPTNGPTTPGDTDPTGRTAPPPTDPPHVYAEPGGVRATNGAWLSNARVDLTGYAPNVGVCLFLPDVAVSSDADCERIVWSAAGDYPIGLTGDGKPVLGVFRALDGETNPLPDADSLGGDYVQIRGVLHDIDEVGSVIVRQFSAENPLTGEAIEYRVNSHGGVEYRESDLAFLNEYDTGWATVGALESIDEWPADIEERVNPLIGQFGDELTPSEGD